MTDPRDEVDTLADEFQVYKEGHRAQLEGPLFQKGISAREAFAGVTVEPVERVAAAAPAVPRLQPHGDQAPPSSHSSKTSARAPLPPEPQGALIEVLTQIQADLHTLRARFDGEAPQTVPSWLLAAAHDRTTCDLPNPARRPSGVRVLPGLQATIERVQKRRGIRSRVGAWEWLLRLGLAAEEHLPL